MLITDLARFNKDLHDMEGKAGYLALLPIDLPASPSHRGYYFGVMIKEALKYEEFGGWNTNLLHDYIKNALNVKSTKNMKVEDFTEFVERAKDEFAKHDIYFEQIDNHYQYGKEKIEKGERAVHIPDF